MRKIFTLIAALAMTMSAMATTFTFTSAGDVSQTKDGITVTLAQASSNNAPFFSNAGEMRLYASNTITVSGADIKNISMTFSKQGSKAYADLSASTGSLVSGGVSTSNSDLKTDTWTGSASTVTFTLGASGQRIITQLVVNGDGSEGSNPGPSEPGDPSEPDTPSGLDPDFVYPEPTVIGVPAKTVQGEPYSFIGTNIEVSCTKGAITDEYFSAHAGFEMTFTATKPIKGIVINGFVKKDFEATASSGKISYLTPSADREADPVLVITDVDSKSVTISCVKQLRCYNVEVYFDTNPEATVSGGSTGSGGEETLVFDSAEAVYESEYVEMIGEENYSVFLFNAASPDVPYFALDIYPAEKDVLTGTYSWNEYTLGDFTYYVFGYGDEDMAWVEDGEVTISKSGDEYTITGTMVCDNNKTYKISFKGEMPIYLDEDYYGDGEGGGDSSSVKAVETAAEGDGRMYDLQGRRVGESFYGIYIRNGRKHIAR